MSCREQRRVVGFESELPSVADGKGDIKNTSSNDVTDFLRETFFPL